MTEKTGVLIYTIPSSHHRCVVSPLSVVSPLTVRPSGQPPYTSANCKKLWMRGSPLSSQSQPGRSSAPPPLLRTNERSARPSGSIVGILIYIGATVIASIRFGDMSISTPYFRDDTLKSVEKLLYYHDIVLFKTRKNTALFLSNVAER